MAGSEMLIWRIDTTVRGQLRVTILTEPHGRWRRQTWGPDH